MRFRVGAVAGLAISVALAAWLVRSVPLVSWELIAYGRSLPIMGTPADIQYAGEGMNASIAVADWPSGGRSFHVSGKVEASTLPQDMRLQRMLGHLPALVHPQPRSVLVVGCGAGVTAGSFVLHPEVERIVICEIEPLIPDVVSYFFEDANYGVLDDPRVEVVYDDARHYILTTKDTFDIVTSDPIHPWVKGSAVLYTKEYFDLCRRHLNPKGVITQWVPLYESSAEAVKSEIATFFDVFPQGTIWANDENGKGYDVVLLGMPDESTINVNDVQRRIDRPDYADVKDSLNEVGFVGALSLLKSYCGRAVDLQPWLEGAEINRDRNLRLQYLAGMGLNRYQSYPIYDEMLKCRKYPEDLFAGSRMYKTALRFVLNRSPKDHEGNASQRGNRPNLGGTP